MSETSKPTGSKRARSDAVLALSQEHGGIENIPADKLEALGVRVVSVVMRGRRTTRVVPLEATAAESSSAPAESKYPTTKIDAEARLSLLAIGRHVGAHLTKENIKPRSQVEVRVSQDAETSNISAEVTRIKQPGRHFEVETRTEVEYSADALTVYGASITTIAPEKGVRYNAPKITTVTEIDPVGLGGFASVMQETIQDVTGFFRWSPPS